MARTATGWSVAREQQLASRWLSADLALLAVDLGCSTRTLRRAAAKLGLPPRDPVQRAIAAGADPNAVSDRRPSLPNISGTGLAPARSGASAMPPTKARHGEAPTLQRQHREAVR